MNSFNILCEEWDQQLHTTWTYKKQKKLILEILKICPTADSFIKVMSKNKLPYEISKRVFLCDKNFTKEQYIQYLKNYIVKYSPVGKFVLSSIIGYGAGFGILYGTRKYLENQLPEPVQQLNKIRNSHENGSLFIASSNDPKIIELSNAASKADSELLKNNPFKRDLMMHRDKYSFIPAVATKFGAGSLAYKLMDKLDKDRI